MEKHQLLSMKKGLSLFSVIAVQKDIWILILLFATPVFTITNVYAQLDDAQNEAEEICNSYADAEWKDRECVFKNTAEGNASKETYGDECESTSFAKKYPNYCPER